MPHKKSTSNSIQNVKYTSINKENKKNINEPGEKVLIFSSARLEETQRVSSNEPSSFESLDSKSRMLLNNLPSGKIVNEPHQAKLCNELPRTAKLDELPRTARLSKKSKDFSDNKQTKSYIITKKIVYASCAIGCTWHMIYK
jgi:hypothetical protein